MASWLVIDWDQDHFHLLSAQSARGGVKVTHAASWPHPEPFTPSTAERVGKAMRDFMKTAQIAAAPVIFGLGRDRLFLKELRFPEIAAHEEANLVRFQTGKELTESIENYAVDYAHMEPDGSGTDRRVMTVAARRDIVNMIQVLCQAAGLKVHAITPKLFGVAQALDRAVRPDPSPLQPKTLNVVLTVGQRWAELCFFKGRRLLQSQALANGPMLVGEIKRNLAVFQAQHAVNLDLSGPDCLFVFGDDQGGVQTAENGHRLPIRMLNPLHLEPQVASQVKNPACFAGAVGLAELFATAVQKPVNLASPKRQSAPTSVSRQRGIFYAAAAAAFLILMTGMMSYVLAQKRGKIGELSKEKLDQEDFLKKFAQERADLDAYRDWEQSTIPWLDEFYDLSARYPWEVGFHVNQMVASTSGTKKGSKDNFVAKINLVGRTPLNKDVFVKNLNDSMSRDGHVRSQQSKVKLQPNFLEYNMKIDVAWQDAKKYSAKLVVPPAQIAAPTPPEPEAPPPMPAVMPPDPPDDKPDPEAKDADPKEGGGK